MIDPSNITNYTQTTAQLEESLLFWVLAAGKNGKTAAKCLDKLLNALNPLGVLTPFEAVRLKCSEDNMPDDFLAWNEACLSLPELMKSCGIGCYNSKCRTLVELAMMNRYLDLHTCTVEELEAVYGIGMKTARCFIIHSRKDAECAGLDTHILKFMRLLGYEAPKSTPTRKKYLELEQEFVKLSRKYKKSVAELDLEIWNHYSVGGKNVT